MQQEEESYGEILELPSEEPPCSVVSTLRQLVHQGTTLKAQILQLSADIPPAFLETKSEFSPILADFRYLKSPETENAKLEKSNFLKNLHERANESLGDVGFRTFDLLHQVVHYHQQTIELIDDIENGRFTEGPLERICQDQDSLCMLIDILYSVGAILLLVDICLPGLMRERLVVAYVRQNKCVHLILQNEMLQKLCQRTGFVTGARAPQGYPERYLSNFPLPERIVRYVLGLLVQTDIGGILKHFPNPAHRTTAMAQQGAQAFVLLYFVPDVLAKDVDFMKQIVERLFSDRWIISWLPGYTANLRLGWDAYRAARSALKNALTGGVRKKLCQQFWDKVDTLCVELERNLKTGGLETDNFLRHSSDIFSLVREANVALQWILLHVFSGEKVPETGDGETVAKLLLNLASWELSLLNMYQDLLDSRHERREIASNLVKDNLRILGESCEAKEGRSSTMKHDSHVLYWLQCLSSEVDALSNVSEREAADKIRSVQRAFDDIGSFWPLDNSTTSIRTVIKEIRTNLCVIQQLTNVRQELMDTLRIASDFSYGFCLAQHEKFIKLLQTIIGKDPTCLEKMGCLLIKMRSILAKPESLQLTSKEEEEEDALTLFGYYENVLKSFGTMVLEHVPECVCAALDQMAVIRTHVQKLTREGKSGEQLSKLGKVIKQSGIKEKTFHDNTKIYGRLAALSSDIALFSSGLKKIENCLKDVMPLTLHGYLEEKVRQHIAKRSSLLANQKLQFGNDAPPFTFKNVTLRGSRPIGMGQTFSGVISGKDEFASCLVDLKDYFDGYLHSLECTHDCLDIPGSGLWHREIAHVIAINLRKEYKGMVKGKSNKGFLKRQLFPDSDSACTFLGRLAREIIRLTSPGTTHYSIQGCYWLDASGNEVFGTSAVESLRMSIGVQGLAALDTLLLARIVKLIEKLHDLCSELCVIQTSAQKPISTYSRELQSCRGLSVPMEGAMWYVEAVYSVGTRNWAPLLEVIAAIGQSQLLRRLIGHVCRNACMLEAPVAFHRAMQALSEFVENKDVDFASGFMSADLSRAASSSLAKDEASELSGSSFVVGGKESDDDFTSVGDLQSGKQSKRQSAEDQAPTLDVPRREDTSNKELVSETLDPGKRDISSLSDDVRNSTTNPGSSSEPESSARQLDTITETAARSFRRRIGVEPPPRAAHPEFYTIDSPNLSASSVRLSDIADSEGVSKPTQRLPAESFGYGNANRTRRPAAFARPSDNSSGYSDGGSLWDPTAFRRRARKDACDTSVGAQTYTSEASSRPLFPFAVNFDALCGDSTCDILGSLTSNASAPILNEQGPRGVFGILQSTGYLSPMTTRYISECSPAADVPIILFLATISIVHKYEFNKQSASLMRPLGSTIPDARSFVSGLVTVLFQYVPTITDQFLRHAGQYVRSYLKTATGATAQGIAAAGVKMILPQEVERTAAFVCEMCEVGGWSRKRAERFIPPFLLDVWMLGV